MRAARHPWRTVAAWGIAMFVALGLTATLLPGALTTDARVTNNPESLRGYDALARRAGPADPATEVRRRALRPAQGGRSGVRRRGRGARTRRRSVDRLRAALYRQARPVARFPDRHALLIPIGLVEPHAQAVERLFKVVDEANAGGEFEVALTGQFTQEHDLQRVSQEDLAKGEFIGMPAAMLVLLLVFGTVVAAGSAVATRDRGDHRRARARRRHRASAGDARSSW